MTDDTAATSTALPVPANTYLMHDPARPVPDGHPWTLVDGFDPSLRQIYSSQAHHWNSVQSVIPYEAPAKPDSSEVRSEQG